jgi:hypothetical protein
MLALAEISLFCFGSRGQVSDQDTHSSVQNEQTNCTGRASVHSRSLKPTATRYHEFLGRLLFLACLDSAALSLGRLPIRRSSYNFRVTRYPGVSVIDSHKPTSRDQSIVGGHLVHE